ncbi:hypothetical protein KUM42_14055 [Modestobacter sp. L9-4]|uniref:hypothetical protein n=1 Tax=Modestobacter sp. L9-4 TaxID=2851567 RepID=UPI001C76CA60|nr:hypothetical protein [Modestobacter sp. L9-4]QXG74964.1 hypothetical protein KUM42_14055 [Modestobacter sp. L9-4]
MGRLIAFVLFVALLVPAAALARAWSLAAGRRAVASAAVGFVALTPAGSAELSRQAAHGRRVRQLGWLFGAAGIVASVVLFAEASVFLWLPALAVGLLAGVLLAEVTRPRPRWTTSRPARRPSRGEQVSLVLLWSMRAVVVGELVTAVLLGSAGHLSDAATTALVVTGVVGWALAEVALARVLFRPLPAEGADLPVDEAQRTWTAHLVVAAASVLALVPLGVLLLIAGVDTGDEVTRSGTALLPVALVAGGFGALAAGLAVASFLLTWLRPLRQAAAALA